MSASSDWVSTEKGWALDFAGEGSGDFVQLASRMTMPSRWTFSFSANIESLSYVSGIFGHTFSTDEWTRAVTLTDGSIQFRNDSGGNTNTDTGVVLVGQHTYSITHDSGTFYVYRDGKSVSGPHVRTGTYTIFRLYSYGINASDGDMLDCIANWNKIHHRVLSPSEIQHLYERPNDMLTRRPTQVAVSSVAAVAFPYQLFFTSKYIQNSLLQR
jgi:hypothetical protein